ncbi:MAG: chromate efflux transporter [Cytophagales bacterium]|nr:chromate efflux transporter [Cytophagales bacterium]
MKEVRRIRYYIFLRDVFVLALSAFGGPQAHLAMLFKLMVTKRNYLTEEELIELNALCQILPGPTSTQTITAIGFKIGGGYLAFLTLLVWITPAITIMTIAAISISLLEKKSMSLEFMRFIQPMAVGFVAFAAYRISATVIHTRTGVTLMVIAAILSYFVRLPWIFPLLILMGGAVTALRYHEQPIVEKEKLRIEWSNFILYASILIAINLIIVITPGFLPVRLFENFYRNGSYIFGGGQVLIPLFYTEFVLAKEYLTSPEFLSGFAMVQAVPGPLFSFSSFIGALSMQNYGIHGQIAGGLIAAAGIFLPGTFLIFFVIRFWEQLKKYRIVRASLEGINAASAGLVTAAAILLFHPPNSPKPFFEQLMDNITNILGITNILIVIGTFCLLMFTKIPSPYIILAGLLAGFAFDYFY